MWQDLWVATALMLVLEGIIPFLSPNLMRQLLAQMANMDDRSFRIGGLISMLLGLLILYLVKSF